MFGSIPRSCRLLAVSQSHFVLGLGTDRRVFYDLKLDYARALGSG